MYSNVSFLRETYLLAIDLDSSVNDKLAGLSFTARKHSAVISGIEYSFEGCKVHFQKLCHLLEMLGQHLVDDAPNTMAVRAKSRD